MASRRLEDRIRELCTKAVAMPHSPEFFAVIEELRRAMQEHTHRLRNMVAKYPGSRERRYGAGPDTPQPLIHCSICAEPISLELNKVDEDGKPMHEECYVAKLTQKPAAQA